MKFLTAAPTAVLVLLLGLLTGCATQITEEPAKPVRASVPLGTFTSVLLVEAELAPEYAGQGANEKAVKKINEVLAGQVAMNLNNVKSITLEEYQSQSYTKPTGAKQTLIVQPYIKQIKFIGGAARFWAGAMAGSSVVIMDTTFIDAATGEEVGKYGSYRKAGAYSDGFGIQSNIMLNTVAEDVGLYISSNR